jgi:hypothetical protein
MERGKKEKGRRVTSPLISGHPGLAWCESVSVGGSHLEVERVSVSGAHLEVVSWPMPVGGPT